MDLTGDWTIIETNLSETCPPDIEQILSPYHSLSILQSGSTVSVCGDAFIHNSSGPLTAAGFTVDSGPCCAVGLPPPHHFYNFSEQLSAMFVVGSPDVAVTRTFTMTPAGPLTAPGPVVCERKSSGVITRVTKSCGSNIDCLDLDPCSRCVGGYCWTNPLCR